MLFSRGDLIADQGGTEDYHHLNRGYEIGFRFDGQCYVYCHTGDGQGFFVRDPAAAGQSLRQTQRQRYRINVTNRQARIYVDNRLVEVFTVSSSLSVGKAGFFSLDGSAESGALIPGFDMTVNTLTGCISGDDGGLDGDDDIPSAGCADATPLELNESYSFEISRPGQNNYYRLAVTQPGYLTVYTDYTEDLLDTYGELLDADCNVITTDDDHGRGYNFQIGWYLESAGTYYVRVSSYHDLLTGGYELQVWLR